MNRLLYLKNGFLLAALFFAILFVMATAQAGREEAAGEDEPMIERVLKAVKVECSTTTGDLRIVVVPEWSPHGAHRFLELVEVGYYNGCALNRAIDGFLTQFGISPDISLRSKYMDATIPDDEEEFEEMAVSFEPGFMSFAGNGENSRTTEVFIVMPNVEDAQLDYFGAENPWETPFGYVLDESLDEVVSSWTTKYGDMPPWGTGPDPQRIYQQDGYDYLQKEFPDLSYIHECKILGETEITEEHFPDDYYSDEEEEEL